MSIFGRILTINANSAAAPLTALTAFSGNYLQAIPPSQKKKNAEMPSDIHFSTFLISMPTNVEKRRQALIYKQKVAYACLFRLCLQVLIAASRERLYNFAIWESILACGNTTAIVDC